MRIKQLHVTRYGPMAPFEHDDLGPFTLVRGPNEQGKTLLIDALVRMLFKKDLRKAYRRHFGTGQRNMNRVTENPEGFVVLESRGTERKLEANETIKDAFPFAFVPDDFRNVFVVRDSDLSLEDEDRYYSRVTEKLTGLRSSELDKLMRAVQKLGRLRSPSPESALANSTDQGKIADKVKDARQLVDEIRDVKEELLADKYDELEGEMMFIRERLAVLTQEAELQRAAEKTERFRRALRALDDFKRMTKRLASLDQLDSEQLKNWQRAATRRETLAADLAEEKKETENIERALRGARKTVTVGQAKVAEAQERLNRVNSELRPRVDEYQYERADFRRAEPQFGTYRKGLYAAAGITALALLGYIVRPSYIIAGVALTGFVVWLTMGWKQIKLRMAEGRLRSKKDRLEGDIEHCGMDVKSVDEVMSAIGDLERDVLSQQQESLAQRAELENLIKEKERLENRIVTKAEQIAELDGDLAALKAASQMESLGEYQAALEKRTKIAATAGAKRMILADILPTDLKGDDALAEWENRIDAHLQTDAEGGRVEFNVEVLKRAGAEIESLEDRRRTIQAAALQGTRKLHGVEIKAKELGVLDSSPPCRTTQELDHIGALIDQFCERIERDQQIAQDALAICRSIDAEERERVSDLFGAQSPVTAYVSAITNGRYVSVDYDAGRNHVYLTTADGGRVAADFLSGGAYDQLYIAIRITIATRLLADDKGFLILDDPFVKADPERLSNMMGMLRGLVDDGWQILYFSAKDEVEQALSADIRDGRVQLVRLEGPAPASGLDDGEVGDRPTDVPTAAQGELTLTQTPDDARAAGANGSQSIL
jgi:exonuclease SbcC